MSRRPFLALALSLSLGVAGAMAPAGWEAVSVLAALVASPPQAVAFVITRAEPVERELAGLPGGVRVFTTFLTVFQIDGRPVSVSAFWAAARVGRRVQAKTTPRAGLQWAARINVITK